MSNAELKIKARRAVSKKSGALSGATLLYGAIYIFVLGAILYVYSMNLITKGVFNSMESMQMYMDKMTADMSYSLIIQGVSVLITALMATFLAGIQYMCISNARGEEIKAGDVFFAIKRNPDKVIILSLVKALLTFVFAIPVNVLAFMSDKLDGSIIFTVVYTLFLILSYVGEAIVAIMMSQCIFAYIDDPDAAIVSYIEKSTTLMRNNIVRYVMLFIGFIPLNIIAIFTMGLMYLWLLPYMWTTYALFYMELINEESKQGSTIDVTI